MATQLNIKDGKTIALVRGIAERRGASLTATVRALAEEEEARRQAEIADRIARVDAIVAAARAKMTPEERALTSKEIMDSIYGPDGLPEEG